MVLLLVVKLRSLLIFTVYMLPKEFNIGILTQLGQRSGPLPVPRLFGLD